MKKLLTTEQIRKEFNTLRSLEKLDVIYEAIDGMERNGKKDILYHIALAMGYEIQEIK